MLLIRGAPLSGESLSSFRQRIWKQNGFRLFPVLPPELRRTDPDLIWSSDVLRSVAQLVAMTAEDMRSLTVWPHPLLAYQRLGKGRRIPRWVSLLQYARQGLGTGSHFCPECLRSGTEAYFKINWRLSVSLACPLHRVQMQNRCPACALPAWPYAAASAIGYFEREIAIDQCPRCGAYLRESPALAETNSALLACAEAINTGKIEPNVGALSEVSMAEWFCALRGIMNLALRSRSRKKVYADAGFSEAAEILNRDNIFSIPFDRLGIPYRRGLVDAAWSILLNWPEQFLGFSERCRIRVIDFSEDRPDLPPWFLRVIDAQLGSASRSVTPALVNAVMHDLRSQGLSVSAESVGRVVGSRYAAAVRARLSKRNVATSEETAALALGLKLYMDSSLSRRISARLVRARNAIALIISIMSRSRFEDVVQLQWPAVQTFVDDRHENDCLNSMLRPVLSDAVAMVRSKWPLWTDELDQGPFFFNHYGVKPNLRGPEEALRYAMRHCDELLWRRPRVFYEPASTDSTQGADHDV